MKSRNSLVNLVLLNLPRIKTLALLMALSLSTSALSL